MKQETVKGGMMTTPNEANGVEETPTQETQSRTFDDISNDMAEATAANDWGRFEELEQEIYSLESSLTEQEEQTGTEVDSTTEDSSEDSSTEVVVDAGSTEGETVAESEQVNNEQPVSQEAPASDAAFKEMREALDRTQRELAAFRAGQSQKPATQPVAQTQDQTVQEEALTVPTPPVRPDIPTDPSLWNEEQIKQYEEFQTAQSTFQSDISKYLQNIGQTQKGLLDNQTEQARIAEETRQRKAAEDATKSHWDGIRNLQNSVTSLKTDTDIVDVHNSMNTFGDNLAMLHGYVPGSTPEQVDAYNRAKNSLVTRYYNNDEGVIGKVNSAGLVKPEGFETYMEISEVNAFRAQMIEANELGKNASFEDAYLLKAKRDGTLADSFNDVAVQERQQANVDTANKIKESQQAVRTPGSVAPASATAGGNAAGEGSGNAMAEFTAEERAMLQKVQFDPSYPATVPGGMELMDSIEKKLGNLGY